MTDPQNSSKAQAEIHANLRRAYDEVINQELPDKLARLLEELRSKEPGQPLEGKKDRHD